MLKGQCHQDLVLVENLMKVLVVTGNIAHSTSHENCYKMVWLRADRNEVAENFKKSGRRFQV